MKPSRNRTETEKLPTAEALKTANKLKFFSEDDPNGSYTGVPENLNEPPTQDVDDL